MAREILKCPRCGEPMILEQDFWRCPMCGGEWWEDESRLSQIEEERRAVAYIMAIREQIRWSVGGRYDEALPPVPCYILKGSSHSSAGRKRKKPPRRLMALGYET